MYVYINKNLNGVHELEIPLMFFEIGKTYQDYLAGKWILLRKQQNAFRLENPDASAKEIIAMELDPVIEPPEPPELPEPEKYTWTEKNEFIEGLMEGLGIQPNEEGGS